MHVVENQQSDRRKKLLTEEDRNAILSLVKQRRYGESVAPFVVGSPGNGLSENELPTIFRRNTQIHIFRCQAEMRKGLPGSRAREGTKISFPDARWENQDFTHFRMVNQRYDKSTVWRIKGMASQQYARTTDCLCR